MIGKSLGHYQIVQQLGQGGMGVVYKAKDTHLDRFVALKVLAPDKVADPERKRRFVQEAKAASALHHPNIIAIHDIDQAAGIDFIAMEYVEGRTLRETVPSGGLPVPEALDYALQMAGALAAAHSSGIVHRDIKPANIMIARSPVGPPHAKILDFGLAKLLEPDADQSGETATLATREATLTQQGALVGTASYMSPEQVEGKKLDARSDVFSFGAVLYEMLTGQRAFQGNSIVSTMSAVLRDDPAAPARLRPEFPAELGHILRRCLEKDRALRYPSCAELYQDLAACQAHLAARRTAMWPLLRNPRVAVPALAVLLAILAAAAWFGVRSYRIRRARNETLPEIARLADQGKYWAAYSLAQKVEQLMPEDLTLARLWPQISLPYSVHTTPPGADVYMKEYSDAGAGWMHLGRTPLDGIRIPKGYFRWRITRDGFRTVEAAGPGNAFTTAMDLTLDAEGAGPAGMVRVPAGAFVANLAGFGYLGPFPLAEYWIDKFEVTNRQYKEFVDRGGYQKREYWKHPFLKDGRVLSWEQAMASFRDATGRPGPSTWETGTYQDGKEDFPVCGVSWYEAAAYAEFAGKSLPTLYHWYRAAEVAASQFSVPLSNFGDSGLARAGSHQGLGPYGTYDMAGNVKEWCWNEEASGGRYTLGGAWNQPPYIFNWPEPLSPFDRAAGNGFRCVKYSGAEAPPPSFAGPMRRRFRDYSREKPVSDAEFRIMKSLYAYEAGPLDTAVVSTDDSSEYWKKLKVTYNAAYGNERIIAWLFLPKHAAPPYQAVVFYPGSNALQAPSSENLVGQAAWQPLIKSGRALLYPVYKGTYERQVGLATGEQNREIVGQWSKDLGRSIDYLESRADIDRNRIAYCGHSMGARVGITLLALEPRVKAAIFLDGGFSFARRPPEIDEFNFAPRVKVPLLMLNGRYDFIFPAETSQKPLFRLIGTPDKDKRYVVYETSHNVLTIGGAMIREALDWLDRYLGPVRM